VLRRLVTLCIVAMMIAAAPLPADESGSSRLSTLLGNDEDAGFRKALSPRAFEFPADHGPHPEYRNEWWYITGNLDSSGGRRFGFELTFFRFALARELPELDSAWRSNQVYIAHLAVTDADGNRFFTSERYSRGAAGLAGAEAAPLRVWIDDWQLRAEETSQTWRLVASAEDMSIDLELVAMKPPVLNGVDGLSQKSSDAGNASYYYSITRLDTEGILTAANEEYSVSGLSWLEREWSSSALAGDQVGWDWFALQLDDGRDLMFYNIRRAGGEQDVHSAGTLVRADGSAYPVNRSDIEITVQDTWESPAGGRYPSKWTIVLPKEDLHLTITPVIANQELFTTVRYWEGAVDVTGESRGEKINGRGYVELTGYAD
jgi:predicted secreted hydrolase